MPPKVTFFFSAFHASHFQFSRGRWKSVFSHISHYLNLMRILMRATAHFGGSSHNVALASWLSGCQSCLPAKVAFSKKNPDHSHLLKVYKVPGKSAFISIHLCKHTHKSVVCGKNYEIKFGATKGWGTQTEELIGLEPCHQEEAGLVSLFQTLLWVELQQGTRMTGRVRQHRSSARPLIPIRASIMSYDISSAHFLASPGTVLSGGNPRRLKHPIRRAVITHPRINQWLLHYSCYF